MRCINCGSDNPDGTKFCGNCGSLLTGMNMAETVQPITPIQPSGNVQPVTARADDPNNRSMKHSDVNKNIESLWIIGAILGILAIFIRLKVMSGILGLFSIIFLLIPGLYLLNKKKVKAIVILSIAGVIFFIVGIGMLIPGKKDPEPSAAPAVTEQQPTTQTTIPTTIATTTTTTEATEETDEPEETEETSEEGPSDDDIRKKVEGGDYSLVSKKFKKTMDSYLKFIDKYVKFMKKYSSGKGNPTKMLKEYTKILGQYEDWINKMDKIDPDELGPADAAYYVLIMAKAEAKLLKIL